MPAALARGSPAETVLVAACAPAGTSSPTASRAAGTVSREVMAAPYGRPPPPALGGTPAFPLRIGGSGPAGGGGWGAARPAGAPLPPLGVVKLDRLGGSVAQSTLTRPRDVNVGRFGG